MDHNSSNRKKKSEWLTRNVWGMALTSFLSDTSHEVATAILPLYLALLGIPAVALGAIEGVADGLSSAAKLTAGWIGDRTPKRKPMVICGYALTGISVGAFAAAASWPFILAVRAIGWLGRGVRGPLRDAILTESVSPSARGRAFGFERMGDTLGAIVGPLGALGLIALLTPILSELLVYRWIFLIAMVPGILAALCFGVFVREQPRQHQPRLQFRAAMASLPRPYRRYLLGVGLFGSGDFAHTLLTLRAVELLTPQFGLATAGTIAVGLYILHNVLYAGMSYPVGVLADRMNKRNLLVLGYLLAAIMGICLMLPFSSPLYLALIFAIAGLYIAVEDTLERAIAADYLPENVRSTGFGALAAVNGVGDLVSSLVVGVLWTAISPAVGFGYSVLLSFVGAIVIWRLRHKSGGAQPRV